MTKNNKGRNGGDRPTPKTFDSRNHTGTDQLTEGFGLSKSRCLRHQQKQKWKCSNQRSRITDALLWPLALLIVIVMLVVSGVSS